MKLKIVGVILAIVLLSTPQFAGAASALEEQDYLYGYSGEIYSFIADQTSKYKVTLTDFEFPTRFDYLGAAITESTNKLASLEFLPFSTETSITALFDGELGKSYKANVLGRTAEPAEAGLFRIEITAVPVPPAVLLLGSGLLALFALKRKRLK